MKEKSKKLILFVMLCLFSVGAILFALRINEIREEGKFDISYIDNYLTGIKYEEISTHLIERPNSVIYVSNSGDKKSEEFEKIFKKVIKQYNLENEIVYINIHDISIFDPVYQFAPQLLFYENGSISDMLDASVLITKEDIIKALTERSVISD